MKKRFSRKSVFSSLALSVLLLLSSCSFLTGEPTTSERVSERDDNPAEEEFPGAANGEVANPIPLERVDFDMQWVRIRDAYINETREGFVAASGRHSGENVYFDIETTLTQQLVDDPAKLNGGSFLVAANYVGDWDGIAVFEITTFHEAKLNAQ